MKKLSQKAFTLVEMLIVIVIIGILIAALLPRLQGAQGMARDTARKTALSNIQAAIVAYQGQTGRWPLATSGATGGILTSELTGLLDMGLITDIPTDNNLDNVWSGFNNKEGGLSGAFHYIVTTKNSNVRGGFILMAKTETPGSSNWVLKPGTNSGQINMGDDIRNIKVCSSVTIQSGSFSNPGNGSPCVADNTSQLRYIVLY
jgi:prepilin-type N-terminal cleavage/methylation domain-containing protein